MCRVSAKIKAKGNSNIHFCFNLHFAFQSFPSDKDTPRTGLCKKVKSCYPHFKIYDFPSSETWVMGLFDTCSYQSARGRQVGKSEEKQILVQRKYYRFLVFVATTPFPRFCPRSKRTKSPLLMRRMRPLWMIWRIFPLMPKSVGDLAASGPETLFW